MPSEAKYESQKLSQNHLSALMRFILLNADGGIQRGEIVEKFHGLERRYCGWFTDPCFSPKQEKDYECRYNRVQPVVSRTLRRLQRCGFVQLIRHGKYVKELRTTPGGIKQEIKKIRSLIFESGVMEMLRLFEIIFLTIRIGQFLWVLIFKEKWL